MNAIYMDKNKASGLFDVKDAERACHEGEVQFMVQHQLVQLALDTQKPRATRDEKRQPMLSLRQVAYKLYRKNQDKYTDLRKAVEVANDDADTDEEAAQKRWELRNLIGKLYSEFIEQFSGVFCATPYAGCRSEIVRHFKADICFLDEAAKVTELETCMIIPQTYPILPSLGRRYHAARPLHAQQS
jgi:hypothetical protein